MFYLQSGNKLIIRIMIQKFEVMNMGDVQKIDKQMKQSSRCRFGWEKPLDSKEPFI